MTITLTRESAALMTASCARAAAFFAGVEHDAELVEVGADGGADLGAVLADAGGEHERVRAVEFEQVRADPAPRLVHEHVERQLGPRVALLGRAPGCRGCRSRRR